jgi:kumamolisin
MTLRDCAVGALGALLAACACGTASAASGELTREAFHGRIVGPVPSSTPIRLHILLQGRNEAELDRLIELQATAGSPEFGAYLTPQEFGRYFGADPVAYARAVATLRADGFTIAELANNRRDIVAVAPAAVVSKFFATPLDLHAEAGRTFYAARFEPTLPAALHAVTVTGLNDYHVMHSHMRVRPTFVSGGLFSWSPADVAVAYDLNPLYALGYNGKGVSIANATAGAATPADLAHFQAIFKLPAAKLVSTPIDGPLSASCGTDCDNGESTLDVDWATAVARGATFHQVVAHSTANSNFDDVYKYIVDSLGATTHVVTTSWGTCEQDMDRSELALDEGYFKQAVAEGQWWFSAAGDNGTDDCQDNTTLAVSVDYPGSSRYVISVGGTNVHATIDGTGKVTKYGSEAVWQYGGCAGSYTNGVDSNGAGGGGRSVLYAKPSYQTALTPKDGRRDVPDVSLLSDDVNDGLFIYQGGLSGGNGGTSEAAPQWAGLLAIVEQRRANYKSVVDPHVRLYQLALKSRASYFHDVLTGNNGVPACAGDIAVFPGYNAQPGFDLATGLGSFIARPLVGSY